MFLYNFAYLTMLVMIGRFLGWLTVYFMNKNGFKSVWKRTIFIVFIPLIAPIHLTLIGHNWSIGDKIATVISVGVAWIYIFTRLQGTETERVRS